MIANATELNDSPSVTYGGEFIRGVRKFKVPWDQRLNMVDELVAYGVMPTAPSCWLNEIQVDPWESACITVPGERDVVSTVNSYEWALITANYGVSPSSDKGDGGSQDSNRRVREYREDGSFLQVTAESELEIITHKGLGLQWEFQDPAKIPFISFDAAPVRSPVTAFDIAWRRVSSPNFDKLDELMGSINDREVTIPVTGLECKSGTLLFQNYTVNYRLDGTNQSDPVTKWEITLRFLRRSLVGAPIYTAVDTVETSNRFDKIITFNHFFRDTPKPGWERIYYAGGQFPYPEVDWTDMFDQIV